MVNFVDISELCDYLKETSSVANVVSDRIYFGEPMREQTGPYVVFNSLSQVVDMVDKKALVECRIVGNNENTLKKDLVNIAKIITDELITTDTKQVYTLGDFKVYKIVEGGDFRMFIDEKNRNLLIKDYIFYFLQ